MEKFKFSAAPAVADTFNGPVFYNAYKDAEFLRSSENVETILSKGYQLRSAIKDISPGMSVKIENMMLERNTPLLMKKTGENVKVENYEFTYNRLTGLVATYAFENRHRFPIIISSEAQALGLTWDNEDTTKCKLYLSAVTGSEHFVAQFEYYPLVCALRKFQLKKLPEHLVVKMAKIKDDNGDTMGKRLCQNYNGTVKMLWGMFPGSNAGDIKNMLSSASFQLKKLFT